MKFLLTELADDGSKMSTVTVEARDATQAARDYRAWCVKAGLKPAPGLRIESGEQAS